ncbi:HhH-GPD domain protein [Bacillus sp. OxB-1]|uniref:DUF488 domain-containing protein n=1 Tax=Bacillus sp. (strain OxB-1) TaxID=98228 RepID=UPI0005822BA8|nr:DUF488 domain-containing protein [Bacillus sp. OxB-1]BAQ10099.1 HhH-GPD domain protein [Bacillus sp. OxB-1]
MELFTIGHSTHSEEEFLKLLLDSKIQRLVDVRAFPGSRKFPQFSQDQMQVWLPEKGITYAHHRQLGGRRNKSKTVDATVNAGWNNRSFHNYADYMLEEEFLTALRQLQEEAATERTAICCSERHPARCHRLLISNWLTLNGWTLTHILDGSKGQTLLEQHEPGKWGAPPVLLGNGTVVYPRIAEEC